jgi:hypothetical protein
VGQPAWDEDEGATMPRPLTPRDLNKRKYWGTSGFVGALIGFVAMKVWKSDLWLIGGAVLGLLGGFVVAAIRDSDEM